MWNPQQGARHEHSDRQAQRRQNRNSGVTEIKKIAGRSHALVIDDGWQDIADTALAFVKRFV